MTENIQLTEGFFQDLFENKVKNDDQPILQVLRTRFLTNSATICMKVQTSDGVFYFNNVGMTVELSDRVKEEKLEELSGFPVIKILSFSCQTSGDKRTMTILDYKILSRPDAKIGEPIQHTGDPSTFTGIMGAKRRMTENSASFGGMPAPPSKRASVDPSSVGLYRISAINPFNTGKWKIQGVVSNKEEMREIQGKGGRGPFKVFNFEVVDKEGSAIRIASFGETAEKIFNQIQKDRTYYISGTSNAIRNANKRFNSTGHDYEISFNSDCVVEDCDEQIAKAKFVLKPVPLAKINELNGQTIDVLGVIEKVEDCQTIMSRDQRELKRRNIHLIDQSGALISLTLWAEHAIAFDVAETEKRVIGIKGAFVREFNGTFSLSINSSSRVEVDPEGPQTDSLMKWYETERPNMEVKTFNQGSQGGNFLEELRSVHAVNKTDMPSRALRGVYFDMVGVINNVRMEGAIYPACPNEGCIKKVTEVDSAFRCEKCAQSFPECKYRYTVSMEVCDATASVWLTLFDEQATKFFGKNATEMNILMRDDRETYNNTFQSKIFTRHQFRCRARMDTYNDVTRPRIQVFDIKTLKLDQFSLALDAQLDKLEKLPA
ncbi:hypothetical protein FO519_000099 [Halicephalobus sp. NKZ332]|nr:hypothetical protein FO519_000099 [Halicephalobus sp. NKZ332]